MPEEVQPKLDLSNEVSEGIADCLWTCYELTPNRLSTPWSDNLNIVLSTSFLGVDHAHTTEGFKFTSFLLRPQTSPSRRIYTCEIFNSPFVAGGHMVQNPKYWRAKECARLQNKTQLTRKVWFFFVYISKWSLVTFFCSPIFWVLYHVTSSCKEPIVISTSGNT